MKLKNWLIGSHLIVMLTPVIAGLLLFLIVNHYNQNTSFQDYISALNTFNAYETKLDNPALYQGQSLKDKDFLAEEDKNRLSVELYNGVGQLLYSSNPGSFFLTLNEEQLYADLYETQAGSKAYTLKKPVFDSNRVVGFYKIAVARTDFIQEVNSRTISIIIIFLLTISAVFAAVMLLLNRKLNQPIRLLAEGMRKFGAGESNRVDYRTKDEIGELITHFNNMKKEIEEKRKAIEAVQKSRKYMISAISYDLKTPLTAIRAYAETLTAEENLDSQSIKDKAQGIVAKSDYLQQMIDDLMMYNLLTTEYQMNFITLEGSELFEMLFSGYEESCRAKKIKLTSDIAVRGEYQTDVRQMTRVIDNLIANAIQHTPEEGHIRLGAFSLDAPLPDWLEQTVAVEIRQWKNHGLLIVVENEGQGIPKQEKERIFQPFYQSDVSRNKKSWIGVGLGLSIVRLIMEKHRGEIRLFSEEAGTVFACWLPMKQKENG